MSSSVQRLMQLFLYTKLHFLTGTLVRFEMRQNTRRQIIMNVMYIMCHCVSGTLWQSPNGLVFVFQGHHRCQNVVLWYNL